MIQRSTKSHRLQNAAPLQSLLSINDNQPDEEKVEAQSQVFFRRKPFG